MINCSIQFLSTTFYLSLWALQNHRFLLFLRSLTPDNFLHICQPLPVFTSFLWQWDFVIHLFLQKHSWSRSSFLYPLSAWISHLTKPQPWSYPSLCLLPGLQLEKLVGNMAQRSRICHCDLWSNSKWALHTAHPPWYVFLVCTLRFRAAAFSANVLPPQNFCFFPSPFTLNIWPQLKAIKRLQSVVGILLGVVRKCALCWTVRWFFLSSSSHKMCSPLGIYYLRFSVL